MAVKLSLHPGLYETADGHTDRHYIELMREQDKTPISTDRKLPKIALVVGPSPFTMPRGWEFFLTAPYEGVTYIATVLFNAGYPVRIIDVRYDPTPLATAYRKVVEWADVLAVATYEDNYPFTEDLIRAVKDTCQRMPVIVGGSLVTSVPHIFMRELPVDIACISEGEITILEVMEAYVKGEWATKLPNIRGIWYRDPHGQVHENPPRGQAPNLDHLPRMNLSLWPQSADSRGLQPQIISSYSRGCKMDCSFCYRTTPQERVKSPEKLDAELRYLKEVHKVEFIFFVDLTFTAHKKQTFAYLEVIKQHKIHWTCLTRNADVDYEVCRAMQDAGCDIALYGVESLAPSVLKEARKGSSENLVQRAMKSTWDAGMNYGGLTIVGLPSEQEETLEHMCSWAEENQHITRVKYLSAMPGTTVYRQAVDSGLIRNEVEHLRWLSVEQALERDEYLNCNNLSENVMRQAYRRLYNAYQPGPVMNFEHFPEHFAYYDPDNIPAKPWRNDFSSAGAFMYQGSEQYRGAHPRQDGVTLARTADNQYIPADDIGRHV